MMSDKLYDFYFKQLAPERLKQQGIEVWEDWWSSTKVFGVLLVLIFVLTVGLCVFAYVIKSGWVMVAAYLPVGLFMLNFFRPKFGLILVTDPDRKVLEMNYSAYLDLRLREYLKERRLMKYEAVEKLADLCQMFSETLMKGRSGSRFVRFSVVFAGVFAFVQPLVSERVERVHLSLLETLWIAVYGIVLVVLVVWCGYQWICLAPLDRVLRKSGRFAGLALKLRQIAYKIQFERDDWMD